MACIVQFKVENEEITLDLLSGPDTLLTNEEILEAIKNNPDIFNTLVNNILSTLYKGDIIKSITITDLLKMKGLSGNISMEALRKEFPNAGLPEGVSVPVLILDRLIIGNKNIYGRIINSNGLELFVIRGSEDDVERLAAFLTRRKTLLENSNIFDENSSYSKDLNVCLKVRNAKTPTVKNINDLLLDFLYNRSKYASLYFTNSKGNRLSVAEYLIDIINIIDERDGRVKFQDPFVQTINATGSYLDDNDYFLSYKQVYFAIKEYHKDTFERLGIKTEADFKEFLNMYEDVEKFFDELFLVEPEFSLKYSKNTLKGIIFVRSFKTLKEKYDISFDTLYSEDIIDDDYYGYKILCWSDSHGKKHYIGSRGYTTENIVTKAFNTEEEVRDFILKSVLSLDIYNHSYLELKSRQPLENGEWTTELESFKIKSQTSMLEGSIVESINIPINLKQQIYNSDENALLRDDDKNYNNFIQIVNEWLISNLLKSKIANEINTPEKIATFIYKLNELLLADRTNEEIISLTVDTISSAPKKAYYIDSRNGMEYRVIPTEPILVINFKKDKQIPTVEFMTKIGNILLSKYGINVILLTAADIKEKFSDIDLNTAKAFVRNGLIYVNTTIARSTDPLHEFTHLILGVLKSNLETRDNYEQLMLITASSKEGKAKIQKIKESYPNSSEMDLMEEAFAELFSNYIINNLLTDFTTLFELTKEDFKSNTAKIFNTRIDDLLSFYTRSMNTLFLKFMDDFSSQINIDFASTSLGRKLSNYISLLILKGKIKEECL